MGIKIVECENHLLFDCDMYATLRDKLITRLNNIPNTYKSPEINTPRNKINNASLRQNLMHLLSPYTTNNLSDAETNQFNTHHKQASFTKHEKELHKQRQSCIINCISSYICNAFKLRVKYIKSIKENRILPSVITINLWYNKPLVNPTVNLMFFPKLWCDHHNVIWEADQSIDEMEHTFFRRKIWLPYKV